MTLGLVGRKTGMTRVFDDSGRSVPVTVLEVESNRVLSVKTDEKDGYSAVKVTAGIANSKRVKKSQIGVYSQANVEAGRGMWEFRLEEDQEAPNVGDSISADLFEKGQKVDITAKSKGKGFQGAVKRWNFSMQRATHGNSISHRAPGSIGQCQTPGRVWKGKKMAGQMGSKKITVQNLEVVGVDLERNLLLIKGAVPGAPGGDVIVKPSVKIKK
jgi:large subunit ribosomal protein L3